MTKPPTDLQTVLKLIRILKPDEQLEVKKRIDFLLSTMIHLVQDDWLTEGIVTELIRKGMLHKGMDWTRVAPKGYRQSVEAVMEFLLKAVRKPLNAAEKYALGRLAARALFDYLENTPGFGLKVMLQNLDKMAPALDASYPGYVASGMLGRLIKVK